MEDDNATSNLDEHCDTALNGDEFVPNLPTNTEEFVPDLSILDKHNQRSRQKSKYSEFIIFSGRKKNTYECGLCKKLFPSGYKLMVHCRIHTGEKPFLCDFDFCDFRSRTKANLKMHMKIHTNERDHKCDICGKTFIQIGNLQQHTMIHTGEKPYECGVCNKMFRSRSDLQKHITVHIPDKPFECDVCAKTFSQKRGLKSHYRIHSGEKPYKCLECGRAFSQSSYRRLHMRTHTGFRPYKCEQCGKAFCQKFTLRDHKIKKHNIDVIEPGEIISENSRGVKPREVKHHDDEMVESDMVNSFRNHEDTRHASYGPGSVDTGAVKASLSDQMEPYGERPLHDVGDTTLGNQFQFSDSEETSSTVSDESVSEFDGRQTLHLDTERAKVDPTLVLDAKDLPHTPIPNIKETIAE